MSAKITITDPISPFNEYEVIEFSLNLSQLNTLRKPY